MLSHSDRSDDVDQSRKVVSRLHFGKFASPEPRPKYTNKPDSTMADYKTYLASAILTEDKVVCYRQCLISGSS